MIEAVSALSSASSQAVGLGSSFATSAVSSSASNATSLAASTPADFGSVLAQVTQDTIGKLKNAEAVSLQGLQGQASVQQVVQTVLDAQSSLQTAIAVRDKVVSSYQELSRMQI